jgi:hypothetical protein
LGGLDCRVYNCSHEDVFRAKIVETAGFVRSALGTPS